MSFRFVAGALMAAALAVAPAVGQAPSDTASIARELDGIRDQLVALNIESALTAVNAILERPGLADAQRVEALDLRAQAHAASDDLSGVEKDFRAILEIKADYVPERAVTSKKAMARFVKIQAAMVGTIQLSLDPKDAALSVDGRPAPVPEAGALKAVIGERRLRFSRAGFDTQETTTRVVAGQDTLLKIQLIPNARTIVVRTDVDGVAVTLDGVSAGVSAPKGSGAELVIENAAIGEHEIRLTKACYAGETVHEVVSVDLADRSPKILGLVVMRPARARVTVTGATYAGELRVDGERVAGLPLTSFTVCPGDRKIEAVTSGRVVWSGRIAAEEADTTLDLAPRPNVALAGSHVPAAWTAIEAGGSVGSPLPLPQGVDLTTSEGWQAVALPQGTDLALGVIPGQGVAGEDRVVLYSPALHEVDAPASPPSAKRPSWRRGAIGAVLVDGASGSVMIASVAPGGAAAKAGLTAGDRLVSLAGRAVSNAAAANATIEKVGANTTLALMVAAPGGSPRKVDCLTSEEMRLAVLTHDDSRVLAAAWASVDIAVGGPDAGVALASLATWLDQAGRDAAALAAWERVRQLGVDALAARAAYAVGVGRAAQGKRSEAVEAFGQARSLATTRGDVATAAAAGDRLADLGVAGR